MEQPNAKNSVKPRSRATWRKWLEKNFRSRSEVWLVSPKASSGKKRIPYNDVVEEALCFGWIDSINKTIDKNHTAQRFSPRRKGVPYSQPNIERLGELVKKKLVHPEILPGVKEVLKKGFSPPAGIIRELKKDKTVWKNFRQFPEGYRRLRLAYIDGAKKRPEEYKKRLRNFIEKTKKNLIIPGYGGMEKYYGFEHKKNK
jgi:uncharacterized protein YdeI (YjbR/CyaY-like superfamily)